MYREKTDVPSGTGELVTVRRYLDPVAAELDKSRLTSEGIESYVREAASFNPALAGAAGGTRLEIRAGDLERAEALLEPARGEEPLDDGEEAGVVRCPRCELAYCFHERMNIEASAGAVAMAFWAAPFLTSRKKRWHCHKCGHVWDDAKEGPAAMTSLLAGDPRPIFRLQRAHGGMGLFVGVMMAMLGGLSLPGLLAPRDASPIVLALVFFAPVVGWAIGRSLKYDVCSSPGCRAPLTHDREDCPRCKGEIAGMVRSAAAHYSAAADFRRELAALRAKDGGRKKKKAKALSAPRPS